MLPPMLLPARPTTANGSVVLHFCTLSIETLPEWPVVIDALLQMVAADRSTLPPTLVSGPLVVEPRSASWVCWFRMRVEPSVSEIQLLPIDTVDALKSPAMLKPENTARAKTVLQLYCQLLASTVKPSTLYSESALAMPLTANAATVAARMVFVLFTGMLP